MRFAYRAFSPGIAQSANGSRSAKSGGKTSVIALLRSGRGRDPDRRGGLLLLVLPHVATSGRVQVAQEHLLVVQRERTDGTRLEHGLGRLEGVAVLQRVLL